MKTLINKISKRTQQFIVMVCFGLIFVSSSYPASAENAISTIKTLKELSANDCGISDAGLKHVTSMKQLTRLSLRQNRITNDGLKSLGGLTRLTSLDLGCHVNHNYGRNCWAWTRFGSAN